MTNDLIKLTSDLFNSQIPLKKYLEEKEKINEQKIFKEEELNNFHTNAKIYEKKLDEKLGIDLTPFDTYLLDLQKCEAKANDECRICFEVIGDEVIGDNECTKIKKCGHCFHKNCITKWALTQRTCPLCRRCFFGKKKSKKSKRRSIKKSKRRSKKKSKRRSKRRSNI